MRVLPDSGGTDPDPEDPEREPVLGNRASNAGGARAPSRRDTVAPMPLNLSSSQSDICSRPSPSAEMLGKEQASLRVSTKRLPLVSTNCRILACSVIGPLSAGVARKLKEPRRGTSVKHKSGRRESNPHPQLGRLELYH